MSKDKSTGKKLADMMYGNPEGAAFGIYPKAGKRSEDKQDREAAKNMPVDLARGVVAGAVGMPGDIESLIRMLPGLNETTVLPTSEDVLKRIPLGSDSPTGRFASGLGTLIGGSAPVGPAIRAVKAAPGALKTVARNVSAPRTLDPQAGAIIIPGTLSQIKEAARQSKGEYGAKRVQRAADEIKNLERMFNEQALRESFLGGDNAQAVVTMNPADFEKYAQELRGRTRADIGPKTAELAKQGEIDKYTVPTDEYIQHLMRVQGGFDQVPYLNMYKDEVGIPSKPEVRGHEGRHRSRALSEAGETASLVQISPRGDLREGLPRRSQEEYIEALREELERSGRLVLPEADGSYRRPAVELPEVYADGGPVHFSDNPDVMQLEMAAGGAVHMAAGGIAKLAKLARAPAKSKQEIQALAERLAPQVTGEYVRKDAKTAKTVADKTQKQFQREKTLPVDVRPTGEERIPQPVDIEKLKGEVMIGIPGDPTLTGKTLYSVGDVKLGSPSPQHGGPQYGLYSEDDKFWASGLGAARRVQNLAKEAAQQYDAPVSGNYIMMGPESINYAQHFADANLQAIDLSKMTKRQIEQFNKLIRFGSPESGPRPSFPGIEDKGEAYLHMAMDPALRKHFNALMQQPTITESLNLPSGTDIRFAITEPSLRDLETGVTGFSMGRMRPDISAKDLELSQHPTYSHDIPGQFIGQSKYPMPYELSFPDTLKMIREDPKRAPHEFGSLKMVGPRQTIDQQMIDEIRAYEERMKALTGKKAGGEVKAPAAQIDGNQFVLAAQKYGLDDSMSTLNKMVSLVNQGATVEEAARTLSGGVRKAEGGEITADDLILEERKL